MKRGSDRGPRIIACGALPPYPDTHIGVLTLRNVDCGECLVALDRLWELGLVKVRGFMVVILERAFPPQVIDDRGLFGIDGSTYELWRGNVIANPFIFSAVNYETATISITSLPVFAPPQLVRALHEWESRIAPNKKRSRRPDFIPTPRLDGRR